MNKPFAFTPDAPEGTEPHVAAGQGISLFAQSCCTCSIETIKDRLKDLPEMVNQFDPCDPDDLDDTKAQVNFCDHVCSELAWVFNHPWFYESSIWLMLLSYKEERLWLVKKWAAFEPVKRQYVLDLFKMFIAEHIYGVTIHKDEKKMSCIWINYFMRNLREVAPDLADSLITTVIEKLVKVGTLLSMNELAFMVSGLPANSHRYWIGEVKSALDNPLAIGRFYWYLLSAETPELSDELQAELRADPDYLAAKDDLDALYAEKEESTT